MIYENFPTIQTSGMIGNVSTPQKFARFLMHVKTKKKYKTAQKNHIRPTWNKNLKT